MGVCPSWEDAVACEGMQIKINLSAHCQGVGRILYSTTSIETLDTVLKFISENCDSQLLAV